MADCVVKLEHRFPYGTMFDDNAALQIKSNFTIYSTLHLLRILEFSLGTKL